MHLGHMIGKTPFELESYIEAGLIRRQVHESEPLAILNYTEKTSFAKHWDSATLWSRGLIYNTETFEVVACGFPKFFNHNEEPAAKFALNEKVIVSDKKDGSLGIFYTRPSDGVAAIATRGSFHSPQAQHATKVLHEKHGYWASIWAEAEADGGVSFTPLFEIIYPSNRIVLDYGDMDDLVLIGGLDLEQKFVESAGSARVYTAWRGSYAEALGIMTYAEALALPPRDNAEGVVLLSNADSRMVKIKQEDYVRLHRIITGLNARSVWAHMAEHDFETDELKESLPEEFWPWVDEVADVLLSREADLWVEIQREYFKRVVVGGDRGQQARAFAGYEHAWALFAYLDEDYARIHNTLWKRLKPEADWSPYAGGEEAVEDSSIKS